MAIEKNNGDLSYYVYVPNSQLQAKSMGKIDKFFSSNPVAECAQKSLEALKTSMENGDLRALDLSQREFEIIKSCQDTLKQPKGAWLIRCKDVKDFHIAMQAEVLKKENKRDAYIDLISRYCGIKEINPILEQWILDPQKVIPFLKKHQEIINGLVSQKKDKELQIFIGNPILSSAIETAELCFEENLLLINRFIEAPLVLQTGFTYESLLLYFVVSTGNRNLLRILENKGLDIHAKDTIGRTILHLAAWGGQKELIKWLVEEKGFDIHAKDNEGTTILHFAVWGGQKELIKWLVEEKGFDIHAKDNEGATILHRAVWGGQKELIKWFLEPGKNRFTLKDLQQIKPPLEQSLYRELVLEQNYPWKFAYPRLQPSVKSMSLPPSVKEIPPLPKSWETIKEETTKLLESKTQYSDHTKILQGVNDLFDRIDTQRVLPSSAGENYYNRMKLYTGHLILYAQEKESRDPTEVEEVYTLLAGTFGRCGGVLEDIEQTYFNRCRKEKVEDLDSAIIAMGFQFRMSFLSSYVDAYLSENVHKSHCFRSLVAPHAGTLEPQEEDRVVSPNLVDELTGRVETFLEELSLAYGIQFVRMLHEQLKKGNKDPTALKIGEGDSFFEKLTDQMLVLNCFSSSFMERLEEKYQEMKQIAKEGTPEQKDKLQEDLQYLIDIEDVPNLPDSILEAIGSHTELDLAEVKALKHYLFYPLAQQLVTKEEVCAYLEKAGWCEKA